MRRSRVLWLTLLLTAGACAAQVAAPRPDTPSAATPSASSRVPNRADDAIYVRQAGKGSPTYISRLDARTGAVQGALPDGVLSPDRSTLYRTESANGANQTRIHQIDVASGERRRAFTVDGAYVPVVSNDGPTGVSAEGHWLVLTRSAAKLDGEWVTGFAVIDTGSGMVTARLEFRSASLYIFTAIAPDGGSLFLTQAGEGATRIRVWDLSRGAFLPDSALGGWDGRQEGFVTAPVTSPEGRRLYWLDAATETRGPFVRSLDLATHRATEIALPETQRSADFEKYPLWSVALSRDGATLYAVNPALGFIDELDAAGLLLRRTHQITVSRAEDTVFVALARFVLPIAEAKRYIRGGALLSPNGRTLYAAGTKGIAVIDTTTLEPRGVWGGERSFDSFSLTPDGARLYAISDQTGKIFIFQTSDGASLGEIRPALYPGTIVRIDPPGTTTTLAPAPPAPCGAYASPDPSVAAEIQNLKTSATVLEVMSPCTMRVRIASGAGALIPFTDRTIILRVTSATTFATASQGDLGAIAALGLRSGDTFTLSFDSRAFADGSYPLTFMNR